MRRELIAIIVTAALLIGAAASQSSWYPRSADYVTTGDFIGDGMNLSGDAVIQGDLAVEGDMTVAGDFAADGNVSFEWGPSPDPTFGMFVWGFLDVWGPAWFWDDVYFMDDITVDGDIVNTALDERIGAIEDDVGDVTNMTTAGGNVADALDGLDTRVGDIETDVGDVANMTTTATDLVGAVNETAGRVDDLETNVGDMPNVTTTAKTAAGAIDELDSDLGSLTSRVGVLEMPPIWRVQTITAPDIGAADTVASTVAVNDTGVNLTAGDLLAQPDVPRTLSFAPSSTLTGFAWIAGTDIDDNAITDTIEWAASDATKYTLNAYKTVTTIDMLKTDGTDRTMNIGTTDNLGMEVIPANVAAVMFTWFDGDLETTLPTVTVGATVPKSLINIDGTLDGTKDIRVYVYEAV